MQFPSVFSLLSVPQKPLRFLPSDTLRVHRETLLSSIAERDPNMLSYNKAESRDDAD